MRKRKFFLRPCCRYTQYLLGPGKNNHKDRTLMNLNFVFYRIFSESVTKVQAKTITKTPPQCEPLTASQPHVAFIITKLKLFPKAEMATWALAFPMWLGVSIGYLAGTKAPTVSMRIIFLNFTFFHCPLIGD
jgi:hypothetical protein